MPVASPTDHGPRPAEIVAGRAVGRNPRRVLLVSPRYARSFGTLDHAFPLVGAAAFMPPQGLLTIAGYQPARWQVTVTRAVTPEAVYRRFAHQLRYTYPNRLRNQRRPSRAELCRGLGVLGRMFWYVGIRGSYRRVFWRTAWPLLRAGRLEKLVHVASVSHHLITFARDVAAGRAEKSFYSPRFEPRWPEPYEPPLRTPEHQT
ncbi:DUF4070 domain-containing protein [Plantactinospora sp. WMMB782]|uniref:DUF4070 domain-containing protein n=1 Tax=Plantactinospora sp. WMMB782 TaxID=3404121 RepID=UPI003B92EAA7